MSVGGLTSIKYTWKVARKVGFLKFYRSLSSKNTCKTCAYGMGGQKGGMVNEAGTILEFCKKSVQAQLTDLQGEIPLSFLEQNSISELKKLSGRELEKLGRFNHPLYKDKNDTHYKPISWDDAINKVINKLKETTPDRSFFYSSGRSSNEAAFILQLFARMYGTNNINNCSYYCHQASGVGINSTIGTGTATIQLSDLKKTDLIFVIGANPASNHPRFVTELMHCRRRGGKVIIINPAKEAGLVKFTVPSDVRSMLTGGSEIASEYIQPNIGGDIALLKGIAKIIIEQNKYDTDFINNYTNGFEEYKNDVANSSWEEIVENSGISKAEIENIANIYIHSKKTVFAWAMGITHHDHGVGNVEAIVNLALLRGMIGQQNAGLLPLRGHSNVQGIGSVGVTPALKEKVFNNIESQLGIKLPTQSGMDTMACIHAAHNGEIDFAFLLGGNLYSGNPDHKFVEDAFNKITFKVYVSTTMNAGHVNGVGQEALILPCAARDEEKQPTTQESMFNFIRMSDGGIVRLNNVRSEVDMISDIAIGVLDEEKVKFKEFKNHQNIRKSIGAIIPGFYKLKDIDETKEEFQIEGRTLHKPEFATADKKANFKVVPIPKLKGNSDSFRMMTVRSEGQFNTIVYENTDIFRGQIERWIVMMNKDDIKDLGLQENDIVSLKNETGSMPGVKVREFDIKKGNILTYFPESNILIPNKTDERSKTPSFKSVEVKIVN
ncbi:MAG: FdhF/YdeP family oxidoreductase [Bacteroidia bacterium]|nr:FdhF/YdeP family oxidoreductase [Bacteroidia bacterium]